MSKFSASASGTANSVNYIPPFCVSRPIVSNTGGAGGVNASNALALRTIKNFVINGAFTYGSVTTAPKMLANVDDEGIDV